MYVDGKEVPLKGELSVPEGPQEITLRIRGTFLHPDGSEWYVDQDVRATRVER